MKLQRRRATSKAAAASRKLVERGSQWLLCSRCQAEEIQVDADVGSVICCRCVQSLIPAPEEKRIVKHVDDNGEKFPRGWHLKKQYVASDGTVYERGKKVESGGSEPVEPKIKRIRTVPSTGVAPRPRGRPRKSTGDVGRKRGRPAKRSDGAPKRKPGRPRKIR